MWRNRILYLAFGWTCLSGQGIYNAVGLGLQHLSVDIASMGISSTGLVPAFSQSLALHNPVTWAASDVVYLTGGYGGIRSSLKGLEVVNRESAPRLIQLIVPVKRRIAWGLGIFPLYNNHFVLHSDTAGVLAGNDTLLTKKEFYGAGGPGVLRTAVTFPLSRFETNAIEFQFALGSSRYSYIYRIDETSFVHSKRSLYSAIILNYYITTSRFRDLPLGLTPYLSYGMTLKPFDSRVIAYPLFEDMDRNDVYNTGDFPAGALLPEPAETFHRQVLRVSELQGGVDVEFTTRLHLFSEFRLQAQEMNLEASLTGLDLHYDRTGHVSIGSVYFARQNPRTAAQYFHYRLGAYHDTWTLAGYKNKLEETGISIGLGLKFGFNNNQIDIAYTYANRKGPLLSYTDTLNRIGIQITLGDIWFVKRRSR